MGKGSLKERSLQRRIARRQRVLGRDGAKPDGRADAASSPSIEADLLDMVDSAIVLVDFDGVINYWSAGAERLYGWSRAAAVGSRIDTLLKTEFLTPNEVIAASLEEQGAWSGELIDTALDGRRIRVHRSYDAGWTARPTPFLKQIPTSHCSRTRRVGRSRWLRLSRRQRTL